MRLLAAILLSMSLAACSGNSSPTALPTPPSPGSSDVATAMPAATEVAADGLEMDGAAYGSRVNPIAFGEPARVGDWEMTMTSVNLDAAKVVAAESPNNAPPAAGRQFVLIGLSGTNKGQEPSSIRAGLASSILGSDGATFSEPCGEIPENLVDLAEVEAGGTVTGNLCFSVDTEQLNDGSALMLDSALAPDGNSQVYFSLN